MVAAKRKCIETDPAEGNDFLLNALVDAVVKDNGADNCRSNQEMIDALTGIPIRNLALQYLFGMDIIPNSRFGSLTGPPKSYKSALGYFLANENALMGGLSFILNSELKPNVSMPKQLAGPYNDVIGNRIKWIDTPTLEDIAAQLNLICDKVENLMKVAQEKKIKMPSIFVLGDSLSSALSASTLQNNAAGKSVGYDDAQAANYIKKTFLNVNKRINRLPICVWFINHLMLRMPGPNARPGAQPEEYNAGGKTKDFVYSFRLTTKRPKNSLKIKSDGEMSRELYLSVMDNTMAIKRNGAMPVDFISTKVGETETDRFAWFNWFAAIVKLLGADGDEKKDQNKAWLIKCAAPKLQIKMINKGKYVSPQYNNGEPMSPTDLGIAIHKDAEMVKFLQDHVLGVQKFTHYVPAGNNGILVPESYAGDGVDGEEVEESEPNIPGAESSDD